MGLILPPAMICVCQTNWLSPEAASVAPLAAASRALRGGVGRDPK